MYKCIITVPTLDMNTIYYYIFSLVSKNVYNTTFVYVNLENVICVYNNYFKTPGCQI